MKNSPHHIKHQQRKAIRKTQKGEYQTEEKGGKKGSHKKFITSPKTNKIAKSRAGSKKKSHKTSPRDVTWETEPENIHREGLHWIKVLQKKTLEFVKTLKKKVEHPKKK